MIYKESNPLQDTPTESILRIVNVAIYTLAKRGEDLKEIYARVNGENPDSEKKLWFWLGCINGVFVHIELMREILKEYVATDSDTPLDEQKCQRLVDKINEELKIYA